MDNFIGKTIFNNFQTDKNINQYINKKNTKSNILYFLEKEIDKLFLKTLDKNTDFYKKISNPLIKKKVKEYLINSATN